eukprot:jgi/Mesen1/11076/ME000099S10514
MDTFTNALPKLPLARSAGQMLNSIASTAMSLNTYNLPTLIGRVSSDGQLYDEPEEGASVAVLLDSKYDVEKAQGMKRLVAFMSQGKDVSEFFPQVVKNIVAQSWEVKRLVYLYLAHYADRRPEEALLSINTFQRELSDPDALVRAQALRAMAGVRLPVVAPLLVMAAQRCARDPSPYVRACAAHALVKVHAMDKHQFQEPLTEASLLALLTLLTLLVALLLGDRSPGVVGAACAAFTAVCPDRLDLVGLRFRALCQMLPTLEEWGQVVLANLLLRYFVGCWGGDPAELRLLLRASAPLLQSSNSAAVLAAASLYWHVAPRGELSKIASPLTFLLRSSPTSEYVVLSNIAAMAGAHPGLFAELYEDFYVRAGDARPVRELKVDVLSLLASEFSVSSILTELQAYMKDPDRQFAALVVRAVGQMAARLPAIADACLEGLLRLALGPHSRRQTAPTAPAQEHAPDTMGREYAGGFDTERQRMRAPREQGSVRGEEDMQETEEEEEEEGVEGERGGAEGQREAEGEKGRGETWRERGHSPEWLAGASSSSNWKQKAAGNVSSSGGVGVGEEAEGGQGERREQEGGSASANGPGEWEGELEQEGSERGGRGGAEEEQRVGAGEGGDGREGGEKKGGGGQWADEAVVAAAVDVMRRIIQREPCRHEKVLARLVRGLEGVRVPAARASIVWLVGEHSATGVAVPRIAPAVMSYAASRFAGEDGMTKLQIVNAAVKVLLNSRAPPASPERRQLELLIDYILRLAARDASYDVRDQARMTRWLLVAHGDLATAESGPGGSVAGAGPSFELLGAASARRSPGVGASGEAMRTGGPQTGGTQQEGFFRGAPIVGNAGARSGAGVAAAAGAGHVAASQEEEARQSDQLARVARTLLMPPKQPEGRQQPPAAADTPQYQIGSMSQLVGHAAPGYEPLPEAGSLSGPPSADAELAPSGAESGERRRGAGAGPRAGRVREKLRRGDTTTAEGPGEGRASENVGEGGGGGGGEGEGGGSIMGVDCVGEDEPGFYSSSSGDDDADGESGGESQHPGSRARARGGATLDGSESDGDVDRQAGVSARGSGRQPPRGGGVTGGSAVARAPRPGRSQRGQQEARAAHARAHAQQEEDHAPLIDFSDELEGEGRRVGEGGGDNSTTHGRVGSMQHGRRRADAEDDYEEEEELGVAGGQGVVGRQGVPGGVGGLETLDLLSGVDLDTWLGSNGGSDAAGPSGRPWEHGRCMYERFPVSIPEIAGATLRRQQLLNFTNGAGLEVDFAFSRAESAHARHLAVARLFFYNRSNEPLSTLVAPEEIDELGPGQAAEGSLHVDLRHQLKPVRLVVSSHRTASPVKLFPDAGTLLRPLPLTDGECKLTGRLPQKKKTSAAHADSAAAQPDALVRHVVKAAVQRTLDAANVAFISTSSSSSGFSPAPSGLGHPSSAPSGGSGGSGGLPFGDGNWPEWCVRFGGETLASDLPCLLTLSSVVNEGASSLLREGQQSAGGGGGVPGSGLWTIPVIVKVNCEDAVFALSLLRFIETSLEAS